VGIYGESIEGEETEMNFLFANSNKFNMIQPNHENRRPEKFNERFLGVLPKRGLGWLCSQVGTDNFEMIGTSASEIWPFQRGGRCVF